MAAFPNGHFYSPIIDLASLEKRQTIIWPAKPPVLQGIDFNKKMQRDLLENEFPLLLKDFMYPEDEDAARQPYDFFVNNGQFSGLDCRTLFVMLRKFRPTRMIEVGSGFSSLLSADVNRNWMGGELEFTCVEPYPREFLKKGVPGISSLITSKVEDVELDIFNQLGENDILFIDSSHVSKTGSDVNYLFFEVVPRLKPGTLIHVHDIFFPYDYPKQWVLKEQRSWNEQYLLRALLMFTDAFEVVFGSAYMYYSFPDLVKGLFGGKLLGGGSFWMRKI